MTLIFLFLIACNISFGQIIITNSTLVESREIQFSPRFIIDQRVYSIRGTYMFKPDGRIIDDQGITKEFIFDTTSGLLSKTLETVAKGFVNKEIYHPPVYRRGKKIKKEYTTIKRVSVFDTLETFYRYDAKKNLIMKRSGSGQFYNANYFEYDSLGNLIRHMVFRETNVGDNRNFKLGVQTMISSETYTYQKLTPTQVKKRFLNDEGKVYKEGILNYDDGGRLLDETYSFVVSWMRSSNTYKYDNDGNLIEKISTSNTAADLKERFTFTYDSVGEIESKKYYKGETLEHEFSFIYDANRRLKSQLDRDFTVPAIWIIKYYYTTLPNRNKF